MAKLAYIRLNRQNASNRRLADVQCQLGALKPTKQLTMFNRKVDA